MPEGSPPLTVAIASSALFDLGESDAVFRGEGTERYREHQRAHERDPLPPGVAFPFIRRLLAVNAIDPAHPPVEVVLISRNDPDTGMRVRNSLDHHGLGIVRAVFTGGKPPYPYIDAFDACLFLSANEADVAAAMRAGYAAGMVLPAPNVRDDDARELRIAFDFDGVLAGDESERIFQEHGIARFHAAEHANAHRALSPGPLQRLLAGIARLQAREVASHGHEAGWQPLIRTAILTARSAPADRRVVTTLRDWGIRVDESFFVGDLPKERILRVFRPHIFFDDKRGNAALAAATVPSVHVPFGVVNDAVGETLDPRP